MEGLSPAGRVLCHVGNFPPLFYHVGSRDQTQALDLAANPFTL